MFKTDSLVEKPSDLAISIMFPDLNSYLGGHNAIITPRKEGQHDQNDTQAVINLNSLIKPHCDEHESNSYCFLLNTLSDIFFKVHP